MHCLSIITCVTFQCQSHFHTVPITLWLCQVKVQPLKVQNRHCCLPTILEQIVLHRLQQTLHVLLEKHKVCFSSIKKRPNNFSNVTELIYKSLWVFRFLNDIFLVILTDRPTKLVVVHCRSVFTFAPESCYPCGIFYFKDAPGSVNPADTVIEATIKEQ